MKKKSKQPNQKEFDKKLSLIEESLQHFQHVVPIETVEPYQNNPRENSEAVDKVVDSLLECGWCNSIAVESMENRIIGPSFSRFFE